MAGHEFNEGEKVSVVDLSVVRAAIAARIDAHRVRLEALRQRRIERRNCGIDAAPSGMVCMSRKMASPRLPPHLRVPTPDPRPPNLQAANLSFAARVVIAVRDRFGGDAPRIYRAAGVTSAAYSQIVSNENHKVSKRTAIRFAFALRLSPEEARLLLKAAGHAFSRAQTEDFVLEACLENSPPIYDFKTVNLLLKEYRIDYQY